MSFICFVRNCDKIDILETMNFWKWSGMALIATHKQFTTSEISPRINRPQNGNYLPHSSTFLSNFLTSLQACQWEHKAMSGTIFLLLCRTVWVTSNIPDVIFISGRKNTVSHYLQPNTYCRTLAFFFLS